jgi:hypothetical protein
MDVAIPPIPPIPQRITLRAFAAVVVPEMAQLDEAAWSDVEATIAHALAQRPRKMQRQLGLFMLLLQHVPRARYARPFSALDATRRTAVVAALERAPLKLIRRGVWGLRTLVLMGFYTRPETMAAVGYRAHPRGWDARRNALP